MPETLNTGDCHGILRKWARRWFIGAVFAAAAGGTATVAFAAWWFAKIGGRGGEQRFFGQALGEMLVGGWLAGITVGLLIAFGYSGYII